MRCSKERAFSADGIDVRIRIRSFEVEFGYDSRSFFFLGLFHVIRLHGVN
jgi:hypothetical protein